VKLSVRSRSGRKVLLSVAVGLIALLPLSPALASSSLTYIAISGAGSSWSSVALSQWAENLHADGIVINFNPDGSAAGRDNYMQQQVDFAASDPPFRNGTDPFDVGGAEHPSVGYSYVPDTAGGTAFMYHLDVDGKLITNLRLAPETYPDYPGDPVGRIGRDVFLHPLDGNSVPLAVECLLQQGQSRKSRHREQAVRADRVLPAVLRRGRPERIE
jgi:hypothetical protein